MKSFLLFLFLLFSISGVAQTYTISGYVYDAESGEKLISANVFNGLTYEGTVTNNFGFYSLTLPAGTLELTASYIGYETKIQDIELSENMTVDLALGLENYLDEIEIVAEKQRNVAEESAMSTIEVPVLQIKKIPALLGEVDVLKALQLLPGVQSGGEGQSGLYVRGGSPDQNLVLLDGVPVYNANHLFGFYSVFNADAIKDVKLVKGGFPARYGGRLSSVLEINMKEGNMKEFHGSGSIGLIASKLTLEGPIKTDKTSFIVSARRTYIDLLARPIIKKAFADEGGSGVAGYYFSDVNAKINHVFSDKDRLYFSVYTGTDKFFADFEEDGDSYRDFTDNTLGWGNITSALRWNHLWSPKLFSNTSLTYSRYDINLNSSFGSDDKRENSLEEFKLSYGSGIYDLAAKIDFDYYPNPNHFIRFGVSGIQHNFEPGAFGLFARVDNEIEIDTTIGQQNVDSGEFDAYIEDDIKVSDKFKVNVGAHLSLFNVQSKNYFSAQPRISMRYLLSDDQSLKASFATMNQYINLLTTEGIGLPTDIWVPSTAKIVPQESWQAAVGYAFKLTQDLDMTVEGYYKEMKNIVSFKDGEGFFDESLSDWGDRVTQGDGDSFGVELFLQKKTGRLTGWVGYTWSKTTRQFDDLNGGREFPFSYDRRHDVSIVAQYDLSKRVNISGTWVYGTGNAVTLASSSFRTVYEEKFGDISAEVQDYTDKNNFRMGAYHRMDIGINFVKKKSSHTRTWSFGAYNAYNRKNPFYIYIDTDRTIDNQGVETSTKVLKQQSIFPILPYFSYSFKF